MSETQFQHGEEGTHSCCNKRLKEEGGKARCCECVPHDGCEKSETQKSECHNAEIKITGTAGYPKYACGKCWSPVKDPYINIQPTKPKEAASEWDGLKDRIATGLVYLCDITDPEKQWPAAEAHAEVIMQEIDLLLAKQREELEKAEIERHKIIVVDHLMEKEESRQELINQMVEWLEGKKKRNYKHSLQPYAVSEDEASGFNQGFNQAIDDTITHLKSLL